MHSPDFQWRRGHLFFLVVGRWKWVFGGGLDFGLLGRIARSSLLRHTLHQTYLPEPPIFSSSSRFAACALVEMWVLLFSFSRFSSLFQNSH